LHFGLNPNKKFSTLAQIDNFARKCAIATKTSFLKFCLVVETQFAQSDCWKSLEKSKKSCPHDRNSIDFANPVINRVVLHEIEHDANSQKVDRFVCDSDGCKNQAVWYVLHCLQGEFMH
jgi:hypothetical protein